MARLCLVLILIAAPWLGGCTVGPSPWSTSVNDWQSRNYETNPFLTGALTSVIPFYPAAAFFAGIPDVFIWNPIQFWINDFWDGRGAPRIHENPAGKRSPWFATGGSSDVAGQ